MTTMNRTVLTFVLAGLCTGGVRAQSTANTPVAQPSSPAPSVAPAAMSSAPAAVQVVDPQAGSASTQSAVTQTVYTPQLPSAAELTNAAAAQGLTVERIVQTSTQVIAFYRNASGQATTVAYQSLPPAVAPAAPAPTAPPAVVVTSPPRTVVYETAPRVVYYNDPYYYPRVWYPPVSLNFGFGYRSFHGHGHGHHFHRGHFHGGHRHR
jgi:hypothetical protein